MFRQQSRVRGISVDLINAWLGIRQQSPDLAKNGETWTLNRMAIGFRDPIQFSKDLGPIHVYFRPKNPRIPSEEWVYLVGYLPTSKNYPEMNAKPIGVARYDPTTESFILTITNAVNVNVWILGLQRIEKTPYIEFIQNKITRVYRMTMKQYDLVKTIIHGTISMVLIRRFEYHDLRGSDTKYWVYVFYDSEVLIFLKYPALLTMGQPNNLYLPIDNSTRMSFLQEIWDYIIIPRLIYFDHDIDDAKRTEIPLKQNQNIML